MEEIPSFVIVLEANLVSTDNFLISLYSPAHGSFHVTQIDWNEQNDEIWYMNDSTKKIKITLKISRYGM